MSGPASSCQSGTQCFSEVLTDTVALSSVSSYRAKTRVERRESCSREDPLARLKARLILADHHVTIQYILAQRLERRAGRSRDDPHPSSTGRRILLLLRREGLSASSRAWQVVKLTFDETSRHRTRHQVPRRVLQPLDAPLFRHFLPHFPPLRFGFSCGKEGVSAASGAVDVAGQARLGIELGSKAAGVVEAVYRLKAGRQRNAG